MKSSANLSKHWFGGLIAALLGLLSISAGNARAQNIVLNGDFATGDLTDWTGLNPPSVSHTGLSIDLAVGFPAVNNLQFISQSLSTTAGATYNLSFALAVDYGAPNEMLANVGGTLGDSPDGVAGSGLPDYISGGTNLIDLVNLPGVAFTPVFTTYSASFIAGPGSTTNLSFAGYNNPSISWLSDISVTQTSPVSAPEPSTWAIMLGGLGLLAFWRTRTRTALIDNQKQPQGTP
jgi:MYXO-CTERM domain-containing protein